MASNVVSESAAEMHSFFLVYKKYKTISFIYFVTVLTSSPCYV